MSGYEHGDPYEDQVTYEDGGYPGSESDTMHEAQRRPFRPRYDPAMHDPYGYGIHLPRMRRHYPIETKPFFLTSEFAVALLAVIALAITAAASDSIDAWRFWLLTTAIVIGYLLSRGVAKSGTRSNAADPREQLNLHRPSHQKERS